MILETIGIAIAPWLGEWLIVGVAGKLVEGAVKHFKPDEMTLLLKQAISAAEAAQPKTGGLFDRCHHDGYQGVKKFLEQFFQSGEVLKELQEPLQDNGKPDLAILIAAFKASAKQHPEAQHYLLNSLPLWMETFVESYFAQVKGICFQVAKAEYLKQLAHRVDDVKFVGIAVPGEEVEKQEVLAQIFVMPDVREEQSRKIDNRLDPILQTVSISVHSAEEASNNYRDSLQPNALLAEQQEWAMRDRSAPRIFAPKILNLSQKKAVVLGAPGSGKTMLVSYFALMLCETLQSDSTQIGLEKDDDYLPVLVRIRDWILQPQMGLLEYLEYYAKTNLCTKLPTEFFEHWLGRGRALILLDGLDEVVDESQRRKVAEQIETFLHQYKDNSVVITSRPAGYRWDFFNLDQFPHYTLESFDDKQVATFIDHWYDSRIENKAKAEQRKADLQKAFARNDRIKLLARNPLLLTIIALIHRYHADLPKQRYELYEIAVKTLLTNWDSGKDLKPYETLQYLKQDDLLYILKKLAYWIHTQGSVGETEGGTIVKKKDLLDQLRIEIQTRKKCEFEEAEEEATRFVNIIQKRTGLLNEQGRDRYAFVHKTFQEYLTAQEIYYRHKREDDTEVILSHFRQHLHDQHWREVLLLLVSQMEGHKARKAIKTILDAKSEYQQWLHRDLLFAGWCLAEDPPDLKDVAEDLVGHILDRLVGLEIESSKRVGEEISAEVTKILYCCGETSVERDVWEKLQAQGDRIDRFRLLKFQAALGHEIAAIKTLLSLLGDQEWDVRSSAAQALGQISKASPEVVSGLLSLLGDRDSHVRYGAAQALGQIGKASPEVVSGLLSLLGDQDSLVRYGAAQALGQIGKASPEVVSGLLSLLGDQDSHVRYGAAQALGQIGNASPEVVSGLLSLLGAQDSDVRYRAAQALVQIGKASPEVVSGLLSLLGAQESHVRYGAAQALGQIGKASPEVVSGLLSLLGAQESHVRYGAAQALGQIGNASPEVVSGLLSLLGAQDSDVRYRAAQALVQIGNASPEVVSYLLSLLGDQDSDVRYHAAEALGQIGNASPEVVSYLLSLLGDQDSDVRYHAAQALGQIGNASPEVVSGLLSLLGDRDSDVRYGAAQALGQIGKASPEVVSGLLSLLGDQESDVRYRAAQALVQIGNASPEVVSGLLSLLGDRESDVRYRAAEALGRLAKTSATIRPEVVQWLEQNPHDDGIGNAIDCLWSIA